MSIEGVERKFPEINSELRKKEATKRWLKQMHPKIKKETEMKLHR